jgi:adenosylcobinamide kinase / adenosylcobinamide-phosphate guanylyltransferase
MKELILGGARSGKSGYAEQRARECGWRVTYIATATPGDAEMQQRIAEHRQHRPGEWLVVEEAVALAEVLARHAAPEHCLIVDCLTLWLSNILFPQDLPGARSPPDAGLFARERVALLDLVPRLPGRVLFVSNEVGLGVVPLGAGTRRFGDEAGRLNQDLARLCERVTFMVAGLPWTLKGPGVA